MSLILKGIDMPNKGKTRRLEIFDDGSIYEDKGAEWQGYPQGSAIQIPKDHGRIGDLDGVIKRIDKSPTFASKYKDTAKLFIDVYSDSNTILESEE